VDDAKGVSLERWWRPACDHIEAARHAGSTCLVHCTHGQSRSVSLVLAYLLMRHNMSLLEAFQLVKRKRCVAAPNSGFITQLAGLELRLSGRTTLDTELYAKSGRVQALQENARHPSGGIPVSPLPAIQTPKIDVTFRRPQRPMPRR